MREVQGMKAEEFNKKMPVGTQVVWFPKGDQMPVITTEIASEATQFPVDNYPRVKLADTVGRVTGEYVPCHNVFKVSAEQMEDIFKILEVRN